ncbi:Hypothetical predicted protein [Cloeon dipterum]|uniref:Uncharacterized protein n=1 Tax=Cloeon dipterum TaxID=197152 RepID=A0A8S1DCH6_9INSE|nr:Hypothetical predicted protein [Cloeon dipterum]
MWPSNCYPAPTQQSCWGWDNGSNYHSNGLYGQWASRQPYSYNGQYRYQQQFTQPPPYPPPTPALGYSTKEYNQEIIQAPSGYSTFNDNEHGTGEHTTTSQKSTSEKPFRYAVSEHDKTPVLPAFPEIKRPYKRKKNKKGKKEKNKVPSIRSATVTAGVEKDDKHSTESNVILTMNDEEMAR